MEHGMLINILRNWRLALSLAATSILPLQSAHAFSASASAVLDWDAFEIVFSTGGGSAPFGALTSASILTPSTGATDSTSHADLTTPTTVGGTISVPGFDFSIIALGSSEVMSAAMSLTTPQPASNFNGTGSIATVAREFSVTASGNGVMTARIPYALNVSTDATGIFGQAEASFSLRRVRGTGSTFSNATFAELFGDAGTNGGLLADAGELSLSMPFLHGDVITFSLQAVAGGSADVPTTVPLPPAVWLFGGALLPLLKRRQKSRALP